MEHVKNKLQQRWTIIFFLVKAKNVGDAGHRRGFLTKYHFKIDSQNAEVII